MTGFRTSHAVVIGINAYGNGIPQLKTAVDDARRIGQVLATEFGYDVQVLTEDVSLGKLRTFFDEFLPAAVQHDDRVLIYFAGHGIARDGDDGPAGYIVPQDARHDDSQTFLPMTDLSDWLNRLPCRHLLLVLDCCFAGAFRWSNVRDFGEVPKVIHRERYDHYISDPAWQVITSAAHDQKAIDFLSGAAIGQRAPDTRAAEHSPFAGAFLRALKGEADLYPRGGPDQAGGDGVITASELYLYLRGQVESEGDGHRQTPGLWPLKKHDKGEYIHLVPGFKINLPPAPALNFANSPYRDLQAYDEEHAPIFKGRGEFVETMVSHITAQPLAIVLGPSGTGKSSVVKAGLVPCLRALGSADWTIVPPIRPGNSPLTALATLSFPIEDANVSATFRAESLTDREALSIRIGAWTKLEPASRLILVVDQLEDLITRCSDPGEREQFLALLDRALKAHPNRLRVVLALRSEFEPAFAQSPLKGEWASSRLVVPTMTLDDYREVIEEPASLRVLYFKGTTSSRGFISRLIGDVVSAPGGLALLSSTLSALYRRYLERRGRDRSLWEADYQELGGVAGLLQDWLNTVYRGLPDDVHRQTMRRVILRMISIEGGEPARRRVPAAELVYVDPGENARVDEVLHRLIEARLVVTGIETDDQAYLEPAHDELLRGLDNVRKWSQDEAEGLKLRRRLAPAAAAWERGQAASWWTDPWLGVLNQVLQSPDSWLNHVETRFIRRSLLLRRVSQGAIAIAFLVLSAVTAFAYYQKNRAETEALIVISRQLTALASHKLDNHEIDLALLLSVHALRNHPTPDAQTVLFDTLSAVHGKESRVPLMDMLSKPGSKNSPFHYAYTNVFDLSFSPDDKTLATILKKVDFGHLQLPDGIVLWSVTANRLAGAPQKYLNEFKPPHHLSFSPDGTRLATAGDNGLVQWRVSRDGPLVDPEVLTKGAGILAYSPDGKRLAAGFEDDSVRSQGRLMIWERSERGRPEPPLIIVKEFSKREGQANCRSIAFSPDSEQLAAAYFIQDLDGKQSNQFVLWDVSRPGVAKELYAAQGGSDGLAFFRAGTLIVSDSDGVEIHAFREQYKLEVPGRSPSCVVGNRDRTILAVGTRVGVSLWDVVEGRTVYGKPTLIESASAVQSVAIDAAGTTLAVGSPGGIVLWDIGGRRRLFKRSATSRDCGKPMSLVFRPEGLHVASAFDKGVALWQIAEQGKPGVPRIVSNLFGNPIRMAVSSDCARLAAAFAKTDGYGTEHKVVMFNLTEQSTQNQVWTRDDRYSTNFTDDSYGPSFSFSPDGTKLAIFDGSVVEFLDAKDRRPLGNPLKISDLPIPGAESRYGPYPNTVAFNHNATILAVGCAGRVLLVDVNSGNAIGQPLECDEGTPTSLAFDPGGSALAIGFRGRKAHSGVVLWDLIARRRRREPLAVTEGSVTAVAFSPDGVSLAVGYVDKEGRGGVLLWDMDVNSWIQRAQNIVHRNFTWDEWREYFGTDVASYQRTFSELPDGAGVAEARQVR